MPEVTLHSVFIIQNYRYMAYDGRVLETINQALGDDFQGDLDLTVQLVPLTRLQSADTFTLEEIVAAIDENGIETSEQTVLELYQERYTNRTKAKGFSWLGWVMLIAFLLLCLAVTSVRW